MMLSRISTQTAGRAAIVLARRRAPTATLRRTFYYGDAKANLDMHLVPRFTAAEEITMDCTAWFVAFALIYTPAREAYDDLDYQTLEDMEDQADAERKQKARRQERQARNEQQKQQSPQQTQITRQEANNDKESPSTQQDHHH